MVPKTHALFSTPEREEEVVERVLALVGEEEKEKGTYVCVCVCV
jgi:hypothetical protein